MWQLSTLSPCVSASLGHSAHLLVMRVKSILDPSCWHLPSHMCRSQITSSLRADTKLNCARFTLYQVGSIKILATILIQATVGELNPVTDLNQSIMVNPVLPQSGQSRGGQHLPASRQSKHAVPRRGTRAGSTCFLAKVALSHLQGLPGERKVRHLTRPRDLQTCTQQLVVVLMMSSHGGVHLL